MKKQAEQPVPTVPVLLCGAGLFDGPDGNSMIATYIFNNDAMIGVLYNAEMSFDELETVMIQEFGNSAPIDTQALTQQLQNGLGVTAAKLRAWLTSDALYYLFECSQGNFIWCIGTDVLMQ